MVKLKLDPERITVNDLVELEGGASSMRFMRDFLARFAVGENDDYLPEDEARQAIGALSLSEMRKAADQFAQAVKDLQESAVPPVSGGN